MSRRGWLLFAAMAVIWGIPYLLIKIAVGELAPATLVLARTTVAATILVPLAIGPMIVIKRLKDSPSVGVVAASLALTALAYAPPGITQLPAHVPSAQVFVSVAILGIVCTALAFLLFFALIAEVGPVRSTVITYFNPAVAIVLGVVLLNEPFTPGIGIGFALIAAGSFIATRRVRGMRRAVAAFPEGAP